MAIPSLPPLAEESVTAQNKDEHKSIADVFPDVQVRIQFFLPVWLLLHLLWK